MTELQRHIAKANREQYEVSMLRQIERFIRPRLLWQREFRFHPQRMWRFDLCQPDLKLAVEVEGGSWVAGRHNRGRGFEQDAEKYAEATIAGYSVLRVTTAMVQDGRALLFVDRFIQAHGAPRGLLNES